MDCSLGLYRQEPRGRHASPFICMHTAHLRWSLAGAKLEARVATSFPRKTFVKLDPRQTQPSAAGKQNRSIDLLLTDSVVDTRDTKHRYRSTDHVIGASDSEDEMPKSFCPMRSLEFGQLKSAATDLHLRVEKYLSSYLRARKYKCMTHGKSAVSRFSLLQILPLRKRQDEAHHGLPAICVGCMCHSLRQRLSSSSSRMVQACSRSKRSCLEHPHCINARKLCRTPQATV